MNNQIHGTCVDLSGTGILLRGPSGSGKSDLALRLIDGGALLVADDRVDLSLDNGALIAAAPANLAGLMEVRGMGIMAMAWAPRTKIALVVDLVAQSALQRLPEPLVCHLLDVELPLINLDPTSASAAAKVRLAVTAAHHQPTALAAVQ